MRELVAEFLSNSMSRRHFVGRLASLGLTASAAESVLQSVALGQPEPDAGKVRIFEGNGAEAFAEQLIASGVEYVFGNSASEDALFYEALVDRPQLKYILTPHEGPGAAMAAGYIKASGKPAVSMEAAIVGLVNAMGQMYNAFKEQTPLIFYSYSRPRSTAAGRDGFEEIHFQERVVSPLTKHHWMASRPDMIPETVWRAFKLAWTPPFGPAYVSWHSDYNTAKVRTEIIPQKHVDPRMRVRPNPTEVERAARLLVEAKRPLLIVGDELYKGKAVGKAVQFAELLGLPVAQARQVFANFPQDHPNWVGEFRSAGRLDFPQDPDLIINVGNKMQHTGSAPMVPRSVQFIDLRNDSASMGNVIRTDVPLVADVAHGLDDLTAALEDVLTPKIRKEITERNDAVRAFSERARNLRALVANNPEWNDSPMQADRVTYEVAQFSDSNAIIVDEAGSIGRAHTFQFNPLGGREHFFYYGAHLGSGVGTAAGVKLARPDQQVICLVGDGSFIFGPTALWNMARLELPVITVVYNNHAYGGPHNRVLSVVPEGRMAQTGQFVHDYLGNPDMNMAHIAQGFGVEAEVVATPRELRRAFGRAHEATRDGKPYLIDAQVARTGPHWAEKPWTPTVSS